MDNLEQVLLVSLQNESFGLILMGFSIANFPCFWSKISNSRSIGPEAIVGPYCPYTKQNNCYFGWSLGMNYAFEKLL